MRNKEKWMHCKYIADDEQMISVVAMNSMQ